jgi:plastocyanin
MTRRPPARPARLTASILAVAGILALAPAAGAASRTVTITDAPAFTPSAASVVRGDRVTWQSSSSLSHDVTADLPGYFGTGAGAIAPGQSYAFTFTQAGRFGYACSMHEGMRGAVIVPVSVQRLPVTGRLRITVGTVTPPAPWRNQVQVRRPRSSTWSTIATTVDIYVDFSPTRKGVYRFRSGVTDGAGHRSAWSPVATWTQY